MRDRDRKPRNQARKYTSDHKEYKMDKLVKSLAAFEDFKANILPAIQKDVSAGMSPKELREKYAALVQARQITSVLAEPDHAKAAHAAQAIIDRTEGKATEQKVVTHKFKDMSEKELDAILQSEEAELKDMQERFEQ